MKYNILVTGGAGYIGSVATELLLKEGHSVIVIDDLSTGHKNFIFNDCPFYQAKISDKLTLKKIFEEHKIDAVLHFAGAALVEESVKNPQKYFDINYYQALNLLNCMCEFNVKNIIFSSTCAIFGVPEKESIPIKEDCPVKPINPYGQSKLLFEKALEWYKTNHNINFIALRYFNVCGATENRGEMHTPETHLIPLILRSAKDKNYKLKIYGKNYDTKDGTTVRDYIHVIDLINAHILALTAIINKNNFSNFYNVGYGDGYSILEIINAVEKTLNIKVNFDFVDKRPGDPPVLVANSQKIMSELKWIPKHNDISKIVLSSLKFI